MEKKTWQKPELIALTRCQPQEAVLTFCKFDDLPSDPATYCVGCVGVPVNYCGSCDIHGLS